LIVSGLVRAGSQSFTGIFTCLAARSESCLCSDTAGPLLANATVADACTLITMSESMKQAFGLIRRPWGVFYLKNKSTGEQKSLKTDDRYEAQRILQAHNETKVQPHFNLSLARVYLNGADPKLATRTWQEVMENIASKKTDETRRRWDVAIKDRNFDCIRKLPVAETRPEHFDRALADGKVSSNVYLRRIHNHALGMEWLLKSVIPRLQWPKPVFKSKRAITAEEHAAIVAREQNAERRDFYELLWHTGASQTDAACLLAEDVQWNSRTISYSRAKLKSRGGMGIKPALIRFGVEIEEILKRRPATGPLFPYLRTVRAGDRATEFKQRCQGLKISGVSLHSYRYAWAERALKCGYPERFAQQALGHNSKAVHYAYSKHAEVTVPSLDDWEKEWGKNSPRSEQPKLLPVDFRPPLAAVAQAN
jgi:integrase